MSLSQLIAHRRVIACVGSGGVGKTTVSAAIAVAAAIQGRRTLVLTIDPAKRLANSLGLSELGNRQSRIELPAGARGELWGMMLDQKRAFDDLVERIAPDEDRRKRILENHYYVQISTALAGSQEYMAMEKLHEVVREERFDLVVLDTPPTKHALDFIDAPRRMTEFLDGKVIQWFVKPYLMAGKVGFKFAQRSASLIFKALERTTGYQALADLAEFFLAFEGLYDGFKTRAAAVKKLLGDPTTGFVIVTTAQHPAVDEAAFFRDKLISSRMPLAGVVFNRVHESAFDNGGPGAIEKASAVIEKLPDYASALDALFDLASNLERIATAEAAIIRDFERANPQTSFVGRIPALAEDVHDIPSLQKVAEYLL
ncbi:AAA family ATPase [bacterium]|nr:AAA family ATPase [bacterium]